MNSVKIIKLARPEYCGDWHDKPLKWKAQGPGIEVQKFSTQRDAKLYARFRRRLPEHEAHAAYLRASVD
jgi:hypothetical protein